MSSFSVTCSRLSQYLKEKGSLADLGIAPRTHDQPTNVLRPPTTMSFLPGVVVLADNPTGTKPMDLLPRRVGISPAGQRADTKEPKKAQLTMFYRGKVLVFDDFPTDKAKHLMQMAGMGSPTASVAADRPPVPASVGHPASQDRPPTTTHCSASDLPIARRASLHRFLDKRKDRINSKAPYQVEGSPSAAVDPPKPEAARPWLGLGQEAPKPAWSG